MKNKNKLLFWRKAASASEFQKQDLSQTAAALKIVSLLLGAGEMDHPEVFLFHNGNEM